MLMGPFLDFSIGSDFSGSGKFGWRSRAYLSNFFKNSSLGLSVFERTGSMIAGVTSPERPAYSPAARARTRSLSP